MLASLLINEAVPGRSVIYGIFEEDCTEEICEEFAPLEEVQPVKAPRVLTKFHKPEYIANFFTQMVNPRPRQGEDAALVWILSLGV